MPLYVKKIGRVHGGFAEGNDAANPARRTIQPYFTSEIAKGKLR
jgi:hypothetical protein